MHKPLPAELVSRLCALDGPDREVDFMLYGWQQDLPSLFEYIVDADGNSHAQFSEGVISICVDGDYMLSITEDLDSAIRFVEEICPDMRWVIQRGRDVYCARLSDRARMYAQHFAKTPALALLKAWAGYEVINA